MTVTAALVRLNEASATRSSTISAEILSHSYRLKQFRRVAIRYEKREVNYRAMVKIAAIVLLWTD
jgi:transposase